MLSEIFSAITAPLKLLSKKSSDDDLGDSLSFKIITENYGILKVSLNRTDNILDLKKNIIFQITELTENFVHMDSDNENVLATIKLRMTNGRELKDTDTLEQLELKNNDEIWMKFRREMKNSAINAQKSFDGPTADEIVAKTRSLPELDPTPVYRLNFFFLDDDLRKVFITAAKESAYVLCTLPCSFKVLAYFQQKIDNYMQRKENAFKVMYKLGYSRDNVERAMKLTANNYRLALDWLIDNATEHEDLRLSKSPRSSLISNKRTSILSSSFNLASTSIPDRLDGLLGVVEFYSDLDEPVYDMNLIKMTRMGYEIEEAREALRIVKNNIGSASDYLAGKTDGSIMELRVGLDRSSVIYESIVKLPGFQEFISYPECFIYLNKILEDHIIEWDPEVPNGRLMRHIILTYHEEKHYLATNQFTISKIPISALSASFT